MRALCSRHLAGFLVAAFMSAAFAPLAAQQQADAAKPPAPAAKNPLLKLVEPWPSADKMRERKADSDALPLFATDAPLDIAVTADFKAINKDRDPASKRRYPGTLRVGDATVDVQVSPRGHLRRMSRTCDYVPLRIEFPKKTMAGTVFAKQEALKLVVQCAGGRDYEQFLRREYLAYRIFNMVTPHSFRARLANVSYVDAKGKAVGTRVGMFLEDESDVAKRMEGRIVDLPRLRFDDLHMDTLMPMMIFEYMIGNTDYSIWALHNVKIVQRPDKTLHPVPYDFDISGLVNPPYAVPAQGLMLKTVLDRMYRGPCRRQELVDPYVANFVAKKDAIRALPASVPGIDRAARDEARGYIDSFYASIKSSRDVRGLFVQCASKSTM